MSTENLSKYSQEPGRSGLFKGILLQDGSSFAVHDSLKETFKGRLTKISPAAIEVHVSWDVLKGYTEAISVSPDSQAEYDFLPDAK